MDGREGPGGQQAERREREGQQVNGTPGGGWTTGVVSGSVPS